LVGWGFAGGGQEGFFIWSQLHRQQLPLAIFIVLCFNLIIAPAVYAAAEGNADMPMIGVLPW